ncbi:SSU ribosomal protein S4P [Thermoplasmatales archaeon BRNA1]|nr:SSU ribosomal protein S4P [Thermoplasmatales archaeon BRNA1]
MGDPKFSRKTYDTPSHPWQGERIQNENVIVRDFGLKNKTEVWKADSLLRNFRKQSRDLQAKLRTGDAQAKIEADALIGRCSRMGILPATGGDLNDILVLQSSDVLNRRLQTIVFQKGLATTIRQARQLINHGHIFVNGHKVTVPGYLVLRSEEPTIEYNPASPFTDSMHPMRMSGANAGANAEAKRAAREQAEAEDAAAARADAEEAGIGAEDADAVKEE